MEEKGEGTDRLIKLRVRFACHLLDGRFIVREVFDQKVLTLYKGQTLETYSLSLILWASRVYCEKLFPDIKKNFHKIDLGKKASIKYYINGGMYIRRILDRKDLMKIYNSKY